MPPEMGRAARTNVRIDTVCQARPAKTLGSVGRCMIGMEPLELAIHRIVDVHPEFAKKRPLGQQRVSHRPAAAEDRGIPKTHIKAQNCAGPDVDQQGQPGTCKLFAMQTVDEDHIGAGMIHLHEVEQPLAFIGTGMGLVRAPLLRTHARTRPLRLRYFPDQSHDGPHAGDFCHGELKSPVICDQ